MASELSKLIEDQLQKHDEEAPLSPREKQRLLSSSLRIKTSPGRKQEKRSPIVKLNKEQPSPPSISGTSVPVPSGQSWVTEDTQKFKWTKWRIGLAVATVFAIAIALLVAFSHPSSKIHHPNISGYTEGEEPPALSAPWDEGSAEMLQGSSAHKKPHSSHTRAHGHAHQQGHTAAGYEASHEGPSSQLTSAASKFGGAASAATYGAAMKDIAAGAAVPVAAPGPARAPLAAVLPPAAVPVMAPGPAQPPAPGPAMRLGPVPGPARAKAAPGKSAGIYMVAGVAGAAQTLPRPALGGYPSADAWDEIHGGGVGSMEQQDVEGVASVAGSPGTVSAEAEDWADEEISEEMEVAGGYPGQSFGEEDDGGIVG